MFQSLIVNPGCESRFWIAQVWESQKADKQSIVPRVKLWMCTACILPTRETCVFANFTAFVGLEGWPRWTILQKQNLEIFNLQYRWENLKESRETGELGGGARVEDVLKRCRI